MKFRPSLFWDIDAGKLDPDKYATYVIERVLDFGNDDEVRWMWQYYGSSRIREVVKSSRVLLGQSRSFWDLMTCPQ